MIVVASIVVSALESLAFVITVIGNLIVIYVMTREKMLLRKSNIYILSVAFADLLMGLMGVPMSILNVSAETLCHQHSLKFYFQANDNRPYNYQLCLYLTCTSVFLCMTAIISLIAVTVDRYRAICHPIAYRSATGTFSTKCIVGLCYALGLLIGFLPALGWRNEEFNGKCFILTTMPFDYILLCTVFTCFGTISVMLVLYGCILYTVCKLVSFKFVDLQYSKSEIGLLYFRKGSEDFRSLLDTIPFRLMTTP